MSWSFVKLRDVVAHFESGKRPKGGVSKYTDGILSLGGEHLDYNGGFFLENPKFVPEKFAESLHKVQIEEGDILIVKDGATTGKISFATAEVKNSVINEHLFQLRPTEAVNSKFLFYFLWSSSGNKEILKDFRGSAQGGITKSVLNVCEVPVASLNEQRRIVEKIETLFARLDAGEAALKKVQTLLARYRQSVLKAAVTGDLTQDWQVQNAGCVESGHDLLQRILKTRRDNWQGRGKYKEPIAPDTTSLPKLPEGWVWASLDALIVDGPTNGLSPKVSTDGTGVPSFKLTATTSGTFVINGETVKYVNAHIEADSKYWLQKDDVLIQRGNTIEYVGTAAIFPGPNNAFIYPDLMMRIRFEDELLARWVVTWINFEYAKKYFRRLATGTAGNMPKINSTTLNTLPVPMPSFEEMQQTLEITESIEHRCRGLEDAARAELARSKALRQSILKQAFAGRLVPQDPNDEPASELLARIRAECQSISNSKRRRSTMLKKQA
ncbi:type I restriction modification DNA specificity domain protein [Candidatus Nitrosoglobus terrae]|uniref:Type I restriction modification DNA specificity domain protein n=1 Tax=Candidatus Nitrosoglobus terrae TaxID=1630141 RepID=A0A1Q2SLY0_9GAMM|nr:restriction endonuclease subunit S [Candidatus Nitrosoglobus terrae]BAW80123.1 type I restriction modification DNA specificity domain protein [Candidatus Nitrosoglobus terrae]